MWPLLALTALAVASTTPGCRERLLTTESYGASSSSAAQCEDFSGVISIAGPSSLDSRGVHYRYSSTQRHGQKIIIRAVMNGDHRNYSGLVVGRKRYAVRLEWVEDESSKAGVASATQHATQDLDADFIVGGYSSGLTEISSAQADADFKVMVAPGACSPSAIVGNNTFGLLPPCGSYHVNPILAIVQAAEAVDARPLDSAVLPSFGPCFTGGGGCKSSLKVGVIRSAGVFPAATSAPVPGICAEQGIEVAEGVEGGPLLVTIPRRATTADVDMALDSLRAKEVNVIVASTYMDEAITILNRTAALDYSLFAITFTATVGLPDYQLMVENGWWQGEFALGSVPWHHDLPGTGEFTGMTSAEFSSEFAALVDSHVYPSYHAAAAAAALVALFEAIERAGSLNTSAVAAELRSMQLQEFYGNISFDRESNQLVSNGGLVIQEIATEATAEDVIVFPDALANHSMTFPMPPLAQRRCVLFGPDSTAGDDNPAVDRLSRQCSGNGMCTLEGYCECYGDFEGSLCDQSPSDELSTATLAAIASVAVVLAAAICIAVYMRRRQRKKRLVVVDKNGWTSCPELTAAKGITFHAFLSHKWPSGAASISSARLRRAPVPKSFVSS